MLVSMHHVCIHAMCYNKIWICLFLLKGGNNKMLYLRQWPFEFKSKYKCSNRMMCKVNKAYNTMYRIQRIESNANKTMHSIQCAQYNAYNTMHEI